MIKLNVEYTIIDINIMKIEAIVKKDSSSTLIEMVLAEAAKKLSEATIKNNLSNNSDIEKFLLNIGKDEIGNK